jgi:hypothetical protein
LAANGVFKMSIRCESSPAEGGIFNQLPGLLSPDNSTL